MSVKRRDEFDKQIEEGQLPEIHEDTIIDIISGLAGQAQDFAKEAALEVFEMLRPRGYMGKYKTNDAFRVGKRVILGWMIERAWSGSGFRVRYGQEQKLTAIDGVFHLLDGKGVMRQDRGPLVNAISGCMGKGETEYFKFRAFKNGNLHLEMKRLDLVKELNYLAAGERVLGEDME